MAAEAAVLQKSTLWAAQAAQAQQEQTARGRDCFACLGAREQHQTLAAAAVPRCVCLLTALLRGVSASMRDRVTCRAACLATFSLQSIISLKANI